MPVRDISFRSTKPRLTAVGIRCADHVTPSTRKSRHYFADSGGLSDGIVRLRTKATELILRDISLWSVCQKSENLFKKHSH
jgi:hypothetical protein